MVAGVRRRGGFRGAWAALLLAGAPGCAGRRGAEAPAPAVAAAGAVDEEAARAVLEEAAGRLDVEVRSRAIRWLVLVDAAPGGGTWGERGLADPNPWVKRAAVEALDARLALAGDAEARARLRALLDRCALDPYVRGRAAMALARAGERAELPRCGGEEPAPLALARAALGDPAGVPELAAALADGAVALDLGFFRDLGEWMAREPASAPVREALAASLGNLEEPARLPAAAALLPLDGGARRVFVAALASPDPVARLEAVDFAAVTPGRAADAVLERAARDGGPLVADCARLALAARRGGDPAPLVAAMRSDSAELREVAVRLAPAGVETGGRRWRAAAEEVVAAGLADAEDQVRLAALAAAARLDAPRLRRPVAALLAADWAPVRVEAAGVLLGGARGLAGAFHGRSTDR